ncbi:SMI1/KNR4 family protein [Nostoc sp.]
MSVTAAVDQLCALYPQVHRQTLTLEEINQYLSEFPFQLSKEFYDLYLSTNGFDRAIQFFGFGEFYRLSEAIETYRACISERGYRANWFPLMAHEESLFIVVGSYQQEIVSPVFRIFPDDFELYVTRNSEPRLHFPSLTELLLEEVQSYLRD